MKQIIAILITGLALAAHAADDKKPEPAPASKDNFFERAAKTIGKDAKGAVHQAGQAYSKAGKDIGHGASKTVKDVGHAMKESIDKTGKQIKDTRK
jgi:gas vesicle protein